MSKKASVPKEKKKKNIYEHKTKFMFGVVLIFISFICLIGVVYLLVNSQQNSVEKIGALEEEIGVLRMESKLARKKVDELESEVGRSLFLDRLIDRAKAVYSVEEQDRREGILWIDRNEKLFIATLGMLNGVESGMRLKIYDGDDEVGFVRVEESLDVISYVNPIDLSLNQFAEDYYRVVFEDPI